MTTADKLKFIAPKDVWFDWRARVDLGDITGLRESIAEKGIIQPLTVAPIERNGQPFKLLAGGRRFHCASELGLAKIPVLIRDTVDEVDEREIELVENIHRKDMDWKEEAALVKRLNDLCQERDLNWSGRKTAQLLGKSSMTVSRALQLSDAIESVPELAECKTQDEALKTLKKLEESVVVAEIRRRQDDALRRGHMDFLKLAETNYKIGDTFKGMAELRTNGMIHFIEVDPPYAIELNEVKRGTPDYVENYNEITPENYPLFIQRLARETFRIANDHCWMIFWFGPTWFNLVKTELEAAGWQVDDIPAVWIKPNGQTNQPEMYLARCYEPFFVCRKGSPVLMKRGRSNVFQYPPAKDKYHPTERPIDMMIELCEVFTVPNSIMFVPFLGSGVSIRAAYKHGLKVFGYDKSGEYKDRFMIAVQRDAQSLTDE